MKNKMSHQACIVAFLFLSTLSFAGLAEEQIDENEPGVTEQGMNNEHLQAIIEKIDPEFVGTAGYWQFKVEQLGVTVVTDSNADRMRIVVPIRKVTELSQEDLYRILQANYDTALDARYAIAKGILWATYIHPLSPLSDEEFLSGLGQTINIVISYGSTYSSGMFNFRGGDSEGIIQKKLLEQLLEKGKVI